jgi:hypothetical protein
LGSFSQISLSPSLHFHDAPPDRSANSRPYQVYLRNFTEPSVVRKPIIRKDFPRVGFVLSNPPRKLRVDLRCATHAPDPPKVEPTKPAEGHNPYVMLESNKRKRGSGGERETACVFPREVSLKPGT